MEVLRTIEGHDGELRCVAFSPGGETIAVGGGRLVQVCDAKTGERLHRFGGHNGPVLQVAWSPDGRFIASAGQDTTLRRWSVEAGRSVKAYRGHTDPVTCVSFTTRGHRLVSGAQHERNRNDIHLWNVDDGQWTYKVRKSAMRRPVHLAVSPDGRQVAVAELGGLVAVYDFDHDPEFGLKERFEAEHSIDSAVTSVAYSRDSARLISTGADGSIAIWNARSGERIVRLSAAGGGPVQSAVFLEDGQSIVAARRDGRIEVWNAGRRTRESSVKTGESQVNGFAASPERLRMAVCGKSGRIEIWSLPKSDQESRAEE